MEKTLCGLIFMFFVFTFVLGAKVGKETTESDMYYRDYKECIQQLPRNMDCEAVNIVFREVKNDK